MTHRVEDTTIAHVMETLIANGLDGMADALSVLMNEAMKLERSKFLGAGPFERSEDRRGSAAGSASWVFASRRCARRPTVRRSTRKPSSVACAANGR